MTGRERARALVAEALAIDAGAVPDDAAIDTVKAWDSLGHLRIILAIEQTLGKPLAPERAVAISSLADIAAALEAV